MKLLSRWLKKPDVSANDGLENPSPIPHPQLKIDKPAKIGTWFLGGSLVAFLLWAGFAPLGEGIPAPGTVMLDTKRKTVQHLTGGLITRIHAREGQSVNAGDILVQLDDALAKTEYEGARHRYLSLRAMESRLIAEQAGNKSIDFHPDVLSEKSDPLVDQHIQIQTQLFASRRLALNSELESITASVQGQQEAVKGYAAQLEARQQQAGYVQEELSGIRDLVKEGYAPRNKQLELERMAADIRASMSDLQANLSRARQSVAELTFRKQQRLHESRKEIDTLLADLRRELSADEERLKASKDAFDRTVIRAPASGSVVGIATQTVGGVIPPGARIMDIVPQDEPLMLEAQLPPHLIDSVKIGQMADIRFSAFLGTPQLTVEGRLETVSADLLVDPATNIPHYLARIAVTPEGLKTLGDRQMLPGMPAEVVIKTGERTLLEYLLHPLIRRLAKGMKEQ